ncbi:IclR family transcriptional regulator [Paenarthrobacter nitroguajacolicus]|uniref:IclR family transcriptional regulator n=1 Tax=Paenarthrobacter nitroguajacolicus TaxID=211146 RepID=UPI00248BF868|nr:IclR family transcriptional regulator C-terminal domain-containing protein [Paenarthrobacter nitroguajacolicus]
MRSHQRDGSAEVFAVIEAVISRPGYGWGVRELAEHLAASKSTISRTLGRLVEERLLSRDVNGAHFVGPRLRVLSRTLHERHPLFTQGCRLLAQLSKDTGATALLAIASNLAEECFVLISHEPDSPVRYTLRPGSRLPLHAGALGLAILSRRGTEGLPEHLTQYTDNSMATRAQVEQALQSHADLDAVVSLGQHIPDAAGIAVPFVLGQHIIGSISLSRPRNEFDETDITKTAGLLHNAASELETAVQSLSGESVTRGKRDLAPATLIERISRLLTALSAKPVTELDSGYLAEVLGAGSVAARRLADSATESGLMIQTGPRHWITGPTLMRWAAELGHHTTLTELIDDELRDLARQTGETVGLALLNDESRTAHIAATHAGKHSGVRYVLEIGSQIPLHAGAAGKAILAHLAPALSEVDLESFTERTITSAVALKADLDVVRNRGWAVGDGERIPEAYGTAAPFFVDGKVRGSLTITIPRYRVQEAPLVELTTAVRSSAARVTKLLSADVS